PVLPLPPRRRRAAPTPRDDGRAGGRRLPLAPRRGTERRRLDAEPGPPRPPVPLRRRPPPAPRRGPRRPRPTPQQAPRRPLAARGGGPSHRHARGAPPGCRPSLRFRPPAQGGAPPPRPG